VRWLDRHALVTMPERIDQAGAAAIGEQLLTIVDGDVLVLILDLTGTTACDHAGGDMLARVYHRAISRGTGLRLVADGEKVLRVLTLTGIDRLVPVHASIGAALSLTAPGERAAPPASTGGAGGAGPPPADVGVEVAVLDRDGVIVSVNDAWHAFAVGNGGDPAMMGPGVSYLDACVAAGDDPVAAQVASVILSALAGDLPGSLTVEVPCHSPYAERWFDVLVSTRRDDDGHSIGATVTLSLTRSQTRVMLPTSQAPGAATARDPDLIDAMTDRLCEVGRILVESVDLARGPLADHLRWAIEELDAIVQAARTGTTPPQRSGEADG
jgi:anti-anti-sigma factor